MRQVIENTFGSRELFWAFILYIMVFFTIISLLIGIIEALLKRRYHREPKWWKIILIGMGSGICVLITFILYLYLQTI